jgi:hypothetical protein
VLAPGFIQTEIENRKKPVTKKIRESQKKDTPQTFLFDLNTDIPCIREGTKK